jgi:hypothetical protein
MRFIVIAVTFAVAAIVVVALAGGREFIKNLLSASGSASWSRTGSFLALLSVLGWDTAFVYWTHTLPTGLVDQVTFVATLYGLGKLGETVQSFSQKSGQITQ